MNIKAKLFDYTKASLLSNKINKISLKAPDVEGIWNRTTPEARVQ